MRRGCGRRRPRRPQVWPIAQPTPCSSSGEDPRRTDARGDRARGAQGLHDFPYFLCTRGWSPTFVTVRFANPIDGTGAKGWAVVAQGIAQSTALAMLRERVRCREMAHALARRVARRSRARGVRWLGLTAVTEGRLSMAGGGSTMSRPWHHFGHGAGGMQQKGSQTWLHSQ